MRASADRLRKVIRLERRKRGWTQKDLGAAAGIKARATIQKLEDGLRLSEGLEGAIEEALDWQVGSLDEIRAGRDPIPRETEPQSEVYRRVVNQDDAWEVEMMKLDTIPLEQRWDAIFAHRKALTERHAEQQPGSSIRRTG